ncbi:hypothetical protein KSF_004700 [Reticulibacter mediterranei]|uniref:Uncharacterized protein n=1 Tax=Reticulibacter mediterranei TaxID=2778369 RepID=A0A8J3N0M2_9CHLR|nr:hypothetical protein [Reticulibacter mediterranei]GHO90422.1 hypothetical protein KSF_004700 [Reticulibacter mediterranei]
MSRCALFRSSCRLGLPSVWRVGLSLFVLSLMVGLLAPSTPGLAHAHVPPARIHIDSDVKFFHFFSATEVAVMGNNGNLWLEHAPFGHVPPDRTLIHGGTDGAVPVSFQAISDTEFLVRDVPRSVFLGDFSELLLFRAPFGLANSTSIDDNVDGYQWLSDTQILVLGLDSKLWLEHAPFGLGHNPPGRLQVDGNVAGFQALSDTQILVLGKDGKLWLEYGPFGHVPPNRLWVDDSVAGFQALSDTQILVLGKDGKLWLEHAPFGVVPPGRVQVDASVDSFRFLDSNTILVRGIDGKLWLEHGPFGHVPPAREQIDGGVAALVGFQPLSATLVGVKGNDNNLWLEQAPFG